MLNNSNNTLKYLSILQYFLLFCSVVLIILGVSKNIELYWAIATLILSCGVNIFYQNLVLKQKLDKINNNFFEQIKAVSTTTELNSLIEQQNTVIQALNQDFRDHLNQFTNLSELIQTLNSKMQQIESQETPEYLSPSEVNQLIKSDETITVLQQQIQDTQTQFNNISQFVQTLNEKIKQIESQEKPEYLSASEVNQLIKLDETITVLEQQIQDTQTQFTNISQFVQTLNSKMQQIESQEKPEYLSVSEVNQLIKSDETITVLQQQIQDTQTQVTNISQFVQTLNSKMQQIESQEKPEYLSTTDLEKSINSQAIILTLQQQIQDTQTQFTNISQFVQTLNAKIKQIESQEKAEFLSASQVNQLIKSDEIITLLEQKYQSNQTQLLNVIELIKTINSKIQQQSQEYQKQLNLINELINSLNSKIKQLETEYKGQRELILQLNISAENTYQDTLRNTQGVEISTKFVDDKIEELGNKLKDLFS